MKQEPAPSDAWDLLNERLTEKRRSKMLAVAEKRTRHIRLVIQDVHDPHNISACMRSAEAFGVLNIDIVNVLSKKFRHGNPSRGSERWLDINYYNDLTSVIGNLKNNGFKIAAGFPDARYQLDEIPVEQPIAMIFGNEHEGIHSEWADHIDYPFTIPTVGMVESLNISVSAALSLHHICTKSRKTLGDEAYYLKQGDRDQILSNWVRHHCRNFDAELARMREKKS